jgi:hypothetical protein
MKNTYIQIAELQEKASSLPHGPAQIALLEEAVQLADTLNEIDLSYEVRGDLMEAATFGGRSDILLVAFAWCLAQFDRDPERFDEFSLLWKYKWVVDNGCSFPQISRARVEELLVDMERRYRETGSTLHAVALYRRKLMEHFGEREKAKAANAEFRKLKRDFLSDCPACVAYDNLKYYLSMGQWTRALQAAQPVLVNRLTCGEQPHITLSGVLLPLFLLGRREEADAYQLQGYRLVGQGRQFIRQHAEQIRYLVLIGDLAKAKQFLERHLPGALESVMLDERFQFFLAARLLTDRLLLRDTRKVKFRLPQGLPAPDKDGKYDVRSLGDWFLAGAQEIAHRFDERNGTSAFQEKIEELPKLLSKALD